MAYGIYIAAVDWDEIGRLREGIQPLVKPRKITFISQLTAYYVPEESLKSCLLRIVDGGQVLSPAFWHPFRVPIVHMPQEVAELEYELRGKWNLLPPEIRAEHGYRHDITEILSVLENAVANESAMVSVVEPPADIERAEKVSCPFDVSSDLPVPWGQLTQLYNPL